MSTHEHQWVERTKDPHPYWRDRDCAVCHLHDMRVREPSGHGPRDEWSVTTPCIEPVPERVSFDVLQAELKQHKVKESPHAVGHPGKWCVGLWIGGSHPYPMIQVPDLDLGWAELLRWVRARQYNVHRYSDIEYQKRLAEPDPCYCDD